MDLWKISIVNKRWGTANAALEIIDRQDITLPANTIERGPEIVQIPPPPRVFSSSRELNLIQSLCRLKSPNSDWKRPRDLVANYWHSVGPSGYDITSIAEEVVYWNWTEHEKNDRKKGGLRDLYCTCRGVSFSGRDGVSTMNVSGWDCGPSNAESGRLA